MRTLIKIVSAACLFMSARAVAQNIIENESSPARERRVIGEAELALLDHALPAPALAAPPGREAGQLSARIDELIHGWPWLPFFHQLGISGAETHFGHPDELFHVVNLALPCLDPERAKKAREFLAARLKETPPYAVAGFPANTGQPREHYTVPDQLRAGKPAAARDLWGVYAFYSFVTLAPDEADAASHWPAIRRRIAPLLEKDYAFDPAGTIYRHDETKRLNGDLAGLYAAIHLARMAQDDAMAAAARRRAGQLLQLRLDVERLNPRLLEPTDVATKTLHHAKLARYLHLPEPALTLLRHDGTAAERIRPFREARPGWWMAFGDRFIGGENYTTSPDFSRALFIAATQLEPVPPETSARWLDVPWCKADFYHIERLALFARSAAGK